MTDIQEALEHARTWTPEEGTTLNATGWIRHQFYSGTALRSDEVAAACNCTPSMLLAAIKTLSGMGYEFTSVDESSSDGKAMKRYRMTNPEHRPTTEQIDAMRVAANQSQKPKGAKKRKAAVQPKKIQEKPEPIPMPAFGSFVEVYLLHKNGDDQVTMGLRDEQSSWMVTITAGAPR